MAWAAAASCQAVFDPLALLRQLLRCVVELRRQKAGGRSTRRCGFTQQTSRLLHMLQALAGDVAQLQCHDLLGDLPAHVLRSAVCRNRGITGQALL